MPARTVLPASPNWYCSKVSDCNSSNLYVFGARHDIFCYNCQTFPPKFNGIFLGHREKVTALCLGRQVEDNSKCCSASEDGVVKLWDTDTREVLLEHTIHSCKVTSVVWSHLQADLIVSGDDRGTIGTWQFSDDRKTTLMPEKGSISCLVFSPISASVVAVGYKSGLILLIDVKKGGYILNRLRGHDEEIHSLAWCPVPGEEFKPATGNQYDDITDLETFGVDDSWRKKAPKSLDVEDGFGTEGWLLASGSKDKTLRIWSTSKGRQLLLLKLPNLGRRERTDDSGRARLWFTICWPQDSPTEIISGSQSGDLLIWDITKSGREKSRLFHPGGQGHQRFVFNICPMGAASDVLVTTSLDRQIIFWNLKMKMLIGVLPSLGGYVYAAKTSPLDPGRLALGVGDNMIRLWNLNTPPDMFDITTLWQGIRGKVTALSWHPKKEGLLAYGTEDGRVGIYDTLSNKPPQISTTYHKRTVYVVSWGPHPDSGDDEKGRGYVVYSVGDGNIIVHDPKNLREEAVVLSKLIYTANPQYVVRKIVRSEVSWSPDYLVLAVGNDDGTVELFKSPGFLHVMTVQVHHKLINSIQWHPYVTMETPGGSPYKYWLATGSTEQMVSVVDVSKIFDSMSLEEGPLHVTECLKKLVGHSNRVTNLAWSPHRDGELVSVSFDGNAIVWDVPSATPKACYHGHIGRLLCVQWSGLDPDVVITGGDDFCAHQWKVSENPVQEGQLDGKKKKKKKKSDYVQVKTEEESVTMVTGIDSMATEDQLEIEKLLKQKKQELEGEGQGNKDMVVSGQDRLDSFVGEIFSKIVTTESSGRERKLATETGDATSIKDRHTPDTGVLKDRKRRKPKSMFPVLGKMENRGKQFLLEDLVTLAKLIYEPEVDANGKPVPVVLSEDTAHLGLFLHRRAVYTCINIEGQHHRNHDNMEYYYQLEIWKGNINGVLRVARQREELSDWLVAMAPMASFDTWTQVCEDYAVQLESDGQYHKAASYFLACHKVYEAIKLFKRHKLFKEAIALAKVRLSPLDPALEELYTLWAHQLTKDGNYEQAAKCHLAMKQVQDAAKLLARRYDQSSLKTAAHISMIANDKQQGLMYTQKVVQQHLLQNEWKDTYSYLREQKGLQVFMTTSSIHEMLSTELTKLGVFDLDKNQFTKWSEEKSHKTMLPDFILDREDIDPMSPWQPHLIEGHTFPHQILRIWYSYLDVPMDTASLEDMYKTLCLLHAGRQTQVEIQQILIQVCTDLTLCMLSLLMSETPTAMSHLLQAVGSLHEAGHTKIMRGLLQLFLPQGPKYILKLQQEITAMRVMISMDTHSHVDGPSKVHTIKRYLSDLKEEGSVNTSSVRCRELDCLRAYYYMTILHFLKERCSSGETSENTTPPNPERKAEPETVNVQTETVDVDNKLVEDNKTGEVKSVDGESVNTDSVFDNQLNGEGSKTISEKKAPPDTRSVNINNNETSSDTVIKESKLSSGDHDKSKEQLDSSVIMKESQATVASEKDMLMEHNSEKHLPASISKNIDSLAVPPALLEPAAVQEVVRPKEHLHSKVMSQMNMNHFSITVSKLTQLSQGLLWDLQAKRYALTETLGYIHKAISQLLLSKKPKPSIADDTVGAERSVVRPSGEGSEYQSESASSERMGTADSKTDTVNSDTNQNTGTSGELGGASGDIGATGTTEDLSHHHEHQNDESHHACPHHTHQGHICQTSLSLHFEHMINIHVPRSGGVPTPEQEAEPEFSSSFFEVCASCELIQKSRKILWEDEPHFLSRSDGGFKDMTNIINPAKYINVPDEWYTMPVDQKYFKPYVTMAILKDEQEYVMHELKRGPDSTQAPFPNPLESVKPLLEVCSHSSHITRVEQQEFVQKVLTWAMSFAITSQQKQMFVDLLQNQLDS